MCLLDCQFLQNQKWSKNPDKIDNYKFEDIKKIAHDLEKNIFKNISYGQSQFIETNRIYPFNLVINSPENVRRYGYIEYPIIPDELNDSQKSILYKQYCYILDDKKASKEEQRHILTRIDDNMFYGDVKLVNEEAEVNSLICNNFKADDYVDILEYPDCRDNYIDVNHIPLNMNPTSYT